MCGMLIEIDAAMGVWCGDCPMWDTSWDACQAKNNTETNSNEEAPDWCPLRQGPITIRLKEKGEGEEVGR